MKLGLIAGNGRFPFLVLDAARAQGHDVTIVAAKEETFPELNDAARRHATPIHWISLGQLGKCMRESVVRCWAERAMVDGLALQPGKAVIAPAVELEHIELLL